MKRLGFLVNPIAGMGGSVGLKGTDGPQILRRAMELGAKPKSPARAKQFLQEILKSKTSLELHTCAGLMGEDEARSCGIEPQRVYGEKKPTTDNQDTKTLTEKLTAGKVDLFVFCGGDGTARDVVDVVNSSLPVLGIPAGVKVYSAVFGANPVACATIATDFLAGYIGTHDAEVMDIDEDDFRSGRLSAKLYGYMKVPLQGSLMQHVKSSSPETLSEKSEQAAIAKHVVEEMDDDSLYIVGPGSTTKAIAELLGVDKTLLGVDVIHKRRMLAKDVNENQILNLIRGKRCKIIVTPIGGQGYIFGRGNQQISSSIIKSVGRDNVIVVATRHKLQSLSSHCLLVDTGDPLVDELLKGYAKMVTGYREMNVLRVE